METPVAYQCAAPSHQLGDGGPDKLTVHDGKWAFCPYDAKADGHEWRSTGGLPLSILKHIPLPRRVDPVKERSET